MRAPWDGRRLLEMLRDELRHLEHADLPLASEDRAELVVRVDHGAFLRVLKLVLLDIRPELLRHLGARQRPRAYDLGEGGRRLHRLHERRARLPLRGGLFPGFCGALLSWHAPLLS